MYIAKVLGDSINGSFRRPVGAEQRIVSRDPGDIGYRVGTFPVYPMHVDAAVAAAVEAAPGWRRLGLEQRSEHLRKFAAVIINRRREFTELVAAEVGKPLWEAKLEIEAAAAQVECELREGIREASPFTVGEVRFGVQGRCRFFPLGVIAVLGAASSPVDLPCAQILPALLQGNTVVYKPSKLVPATGQFLAELFLEIELPRGVFNMIQGEAAAGLALASHPQVDGVLFCGGSLGGRRILDAVRDRPHKMVALHIGGVNPALVLEDADLDLAAVECAKGAFQTAGQRTTSTGVVLVSASVFKEFLDRLVRIASQLTVGYAFDEDVFMGPVLSQTALERALERQAKLIGLGAKTAVSLARAELPREGYYLSPGVLFLDEPRCIGDIRPEGQSFGPDLVVMPFSKDLEAVALANSATHRLAATVLTEDLGRFDRLADELLFGVVNHNLATTEISMRLPLEGWGESGNHRPAGVFTQRNCTAPRVTLASRGGQDQNHDLPGFPQIRS